MFVFMSGGDRGRYYSPDHSSPRKDEDSIEAHRKRMETLRAATGTEVGNEQDAPDRLAEPSMINLGRTILSEILDRYVAWHEKPVIGAERTPTERIGSHESPLQPEVLYADGEVYDFVRQ